MILLTLLVGCGSTSKAPPRTKIYWDTLIEFDTLDEMIDHIKKRELK